MIAILLDSANFFVTVGEVIVLKDKKLMNFFSTN